MKPSRASGYSKSDDRAPSRAMRAVMHQRRNQVVEFAAGRGQGPSDIHQRLAPPSIVQLMHHINSSPVFIQLRRNRKRLELAIC